MASRRVNKNMFLCLKSRKSIASATPLLAFGLLTVMAIAPVDGGQTHIEQVFVEKLPGDVKLELVAVPAGEFLMGSKLLERSQPVHKVKLKPFFVGKYEITQAQWQSVTGSDPSSFKGDDLPVETVSWYDAKEFCVRLSEITGRRYRLPSEAEWEYAARAGSAADYCFGNNAKLLNEYAWYQENSDGKTHGVGQKMSNSWGLYDVHGNVWEWCEDFWHPDYHGAPADGAAWVKGGDKTGVILRGGSWDLTKDLARVAFRLYVKPDSRRSLFGFRVVLDKSPSSTSAL